jgi:hypothetical protein
LPEGAPVFAARDEVVGFEVLTPVFAVVEFAALPVREDNVGLAGFGKPAASVTPAVVLRFGEVVELVVFAGLPVPPAVVVLPRFAEVTVPVVRFTESKGLVVVRLAATEELVLFAWLLGVTAELVGGVVFAGVVVLFGAAVDELPVNLACDSSIFISAAVLATICGFPLKSAAVPVTQILLLR